MLHRVQKVFNRHLTPVKITYYRFRFTAVESIVSDV
mgnify:CR=1 FL=1